MYKLKLLLLILCPVLCFGQKEYKIFSIPKKGNAKVTAQTVALYKTVNNYTLLTANTSQLMKDKPETFSMKVGTKKLKLSHVKFNPVITVTGHQKVKVVAESYEYFKLSKGKRNEFSAFTFTKDAEGLVVDAEGNLNVGKSGGYSIAYNDSDLINVKPFICYGDTAIDRASLKKKILSMQRIASLTADHCVHWDWELNTEVYQSYGTDPQAAQLALNWAQTIFAINQAFYAGQGINVVLDNLKIWTTTSPYTGPTTTDYFNAFWQKRAISVNPAILIGFNAPGGRAWIGGLCTFPNTGYCGVYKSFSNIPTYSWTVDCICHEEGHQYGSPHTHDCWWNGNQTEIDGCGDVAGYKSGTCPTVLPLPASGGTIMSYCHLTSVGKNLSLGFGPQPLAVIMANINAATCLPVCGTPPPPPVCPSQPGTITGNVSVTVGSSQTYSITAVSGATSYLWKLPAGWSGSSVNTSITTTVGSSSGTISVAAVNSCGTSAFSNLSVNVIIPPPPPNIDSSCKNMGIGVTFQKNSAGWKCQPTSGTNWTDQWRVNNGVVISTTQILALKFFKSGDIISVVVHSTSSTKCGWGSMRVP